MRASPGGHGIQKAFDPVAEIIYSFGKNRILYQTECFIMRSLAFKSISVGFYWFICYWVNFFPSKDLL